MSIGIDAAVYDEADGNRHVLGNLILPITVSEIGDRFDAAARLGAVTPKPGSERPHRDVVDVPATLARLEGLGLAKRFSGHETFADLIEATDADPEVVQNDLDPQDTPHAEGAYHQTETRGGLWAINQTAGLADPAVEHWVMTKTGFRELTGHDQNGVSE